MDVKRAAAERVSFLCSRPCCRASTGGPQVADSRAVNLGVAAHITAAAPGGPRYDPSMTPEERRGVYNAIWLCQTCAKLVDNDPDRFTVAVLRDWKLQAQAEAMANVGKPRSADTSRDAATIARASLMDHRFQMVMDNYRGSPKFMIDTFKDLSQLEKADLYERVIRAKKHRAPKMNPYT